ncbi:hypothetical protein Cob_v009675 [Colletotrichum orbiculare MAFF 240422]|uniref:Uncharacterized protein n=1 Tax=Colletotrichum orbiculare (strain 104-T / ATCC 96160 / CBS 514.97 / LARS 414 / MAFF 240422) TaxID=1213857 RepID=A0A484FJF9_COLOR|nr:hypothetical protein Cob_v009675 [Colletotrichum orbiculare MAFF 240422]
MNHQIKYNEATRSLQSLLHPIVQATALTWKGEWARQNPGLMHISCTADNIPYEATLNSSPFAVHKCPKPPDDVLVSICTPASMRFRFDWPDPLPWLQFQSKFSEVLSNL